jgi:seryl-tRNA synthetase
MTDWSRLARAVTFFTQREYRYFEVPWAISEEAISITATEARWRDIALTPFGYLVGSAEQSFLQMVLDQRISRGKYVACSPCFRPCETVDLLHRQHFMKVELFRNDELDDVALTDMREDAFDFATLELTYAHTGLATTGLHWTATSEGMDLDLGAVEIGSYGRREHPLVGGWLYGTGVAEPRFSTALGLLGGQ